MNLINQTSLNSERLTALIEAAARAIQKPVSLDIVTVVRRSQSFKMEGRCYGAPLFSATTDTISCKMRVQYLAHVGKRRIFTNSAWIVLLIPKFFNNAGKTAENFFNTVKHELVHVYDYQELNRVVHEHGAAYIAENRARIGLDFAPRDSRTKRRPRWASRPEERRAVEGAKLGDPKDFPEVAALAAEITNCSTQTIHPIISHLRILCPKGSAPQAPRPRGAITLGRGTHPMTPSLHPSPFFLLCEKKATRRHKVAG